MIGKDPTIEPATEMERAVEETYRLRTPVGDPCSYCFKPLHHPAIYWRLGDARLWFHPGCALRFASHLIRDMSELRELEELRDRLTTEGVEK